MAEGRLCVQYYPESPSRKGVWKFDIFDEFPGEYDLMICGRLGQKKDSKPTIRVTLNQSILYEGPARFTYDSWSFMKLVLGWEHLNPKDNRLTIENISPREKWSEPLTYYLNYAIVRPKDAEETDPGGPVPDGLQD